METNRHCIFSTIPKYVAEEPYGTIWFHRRAKENHKYILQDMRISKSSDGVTTESHYQIYEGFTYSMWGSYPLIFDQSTLGMITLGKYELTGYTPLNNFETKEYTFSARNTDSNNPHAFCAIIYFEEVPMTKAEILEYAVKQPRYKYRHGGASTVERIEAGYID